MIRAYTLLILLSFLTFSASGQWYPIGEPYYTQYLYQSREDSSKEWENNSRTRFGYDQSNRRNLVESYVWLNNSWRLQNEQKREFDNENNLIYHSDKWWNTEPYKLAGESTTKTEFVEKRVVRNERWFRDYNSGNTYESSTEYKYDANGNHLESTRRSRENNLPYRESKYNTYYNKNQCQVSWVSRRREGEGDWYSIDSTYLQVDSECQTNLEQRFSVDPETNESELQAEYRYARDYDEHGKLTYYKLEERLQGQDWSIIFEEFFLYDPSFGRIYEEHRSYQDTVFFGYRINFNYSVDSLDYLQVMDIKEPQDSTWKPAGFNGYRVNSFGEIEYSIGQNIWYEDNGKYIDNNWHQSHFNSENELVKTIFYAEQIGPESEIQWFNKTEKVFNRRCDGAELESVSTVLESSETELLGRQDRRETGHLLQPLCAQADESSKITIYPNPAQNYIHVSYPETIGKSRISIVDQTGKLVLEKEQFVSSYFTLDFSTMIAGSYILKIESENVNDSQRFVVVK